MTAPPLSLGAEMRSRRESAQDAQNEVCLIICNHGAHATLLMAHPEHGFGMLRHRGAIVIALTRVPICS